MQLPVFSAFCGNPAGDVFADFLKSALNFAYQVILSVNLHKVLYSLLIVSILKMDSQRKSKKEWNGHS